MRQCVGNCFPPNAGALGLDVSGVCESHARTHRPRETSPRQPGAAGDGPCLRLCSKADSHPDLSIVLVHKHLTILFN
jgi:hypothetical protein